MSSYFFAQLNITDKDEYRKYEQGFSEIFSRYSGEIIVIDDKPIVLEGDSLSTRIVLIRFPNEEALKDWYYSGEYQALSQIRKHASTGSALILTGLDEIIARMTQRKQNAE
jgi:uncharacterized protein (DUF1330 family)